MAIWKQRQQVKRKFFDEKAPQWDGFSAPSDAEEKQLEFVRRATSHTPLQILDAGCGTGVLLPALRRFCPAVKVVELDFSRKMLAINIAKHGGETIEYRCEAIESTSLEAESFDAILCFNALPHFKIGKALPRIAELLSAGGRIAVGHLMSSDELNVFHSSVQGPVAHDKLPAAEDLSSMLLGVGLLVIHSEEWSGWYFVLAEKPALAKHNAQSK